MAYDFHIVLNTYERPDHLDRLTKQICLEASKMGCRVLVSVFFDGCPPYPINGSELVDTRAYNMVRHRGKKHYYELIKMNFEVLRDNPATIYIKLDDDLILRHEFFSKIALLWKSIKDDKKMTLTLLKDHRTGMWGGLPEQYNNQITKSNWADLIFACGQRMVDAMDKMELLPPPSHIESSGVARQITRNIRGFRWNDELRTEYKFGESLGNMYQVKDTLVNHGNHESKMNPQRKNESW